MKRSLIIMLALTLILLTVGTGFAKSGPADLSIALQAKMEKGASHSINVLISTADNDYSAVIAEVEAQGGSVYATFDYAKGLAATLPATSINSVAAVAGVEGIALDAVRTLDTDVQPFVQQELDSTQDLDAYSAAGTGFSLDGNFEALTLDPAAVPDTYYGFESMNTIPVWDTGNGGQDSLVVVIDTGVYADHFLLAGSVVGGIDLSTDVGGAFEGATHVDNHYHGTHVGGIIAGHGYLLLDPGDPFVASYEYYTGTSLEVDPGTGDKIFPLLGTAPAADLYAVKVFPHTGAGAPTSTIIAGIEHAIDLHVNGVYDVDVINMSLGGATLFDGRDLEDQVVDYATSLGITMVVAASNDGPSSMTVASPGTSNTAITTGAVAHPINTRFFWDFNYGLFGIGDLLFVDENPQMMYFSSRGPTADGQQKPTASAVGVFVLSAFTGSPTSLGFLSGTSMATPGMAGIVALMNTANEAYAMGGSPYDYKQAVIAGSNMLPGYEAFEQGAGFIDAAAAYQAFMDDNSLGDVEPELRKGYSANTVNPAGDKLSKVNGGKGETFEINDLAPGYVEHFYFDLLPNAEKIVVEFSNVDLGVDPIEFNSFEVHLTSAITSSDSTYYFATTNVWGDAVFEVESLSSTVSGTVFGVNAFDLPLMPGKIRLTIENDWTSFDNLSGTVHVKVISGNNSEKADATYEGTVNTGESYGFFPVAAGPVELELSWKNDWSKYPTSDLDMIVAWFDTDGVLHYEYGGATLNSPEMVSLTSSDVAEVYVLIDGYDTNGVDEPWTLEVNYK